MAINLDPSRERFELRLREPVELQGLFAFSKRFNRHMPHKNQPNRESQLFLCIGGNVKVLDNARHA